MRLIDADKIEYYSVDKDGKHIGEMVWKPHVDSIETFDLEAHDTEIKTEAIEEFIKFCVLNFPIDIISTHEAIEEMKKCCNQLKEKENDALEYLLLPYKRGYQKGREDDALEYLLLPYKRGYQKGREDALAEKKYIIKEDGSIHSMDKDMEDAYNRGREEAIDECIKFIREHSGMHLVDCDCYFNSGDDEELIFSVDDWIDDLEQLKEKAEE